MKDCFDATAKTQNIAPQLFDKGYNFALFDVISLFTNVTLNRTVNVILDHVYNENRVNINLTKKTVKKLIKDTCSKTIFTVNKKLYQQYGVSMGSSLVSLLANIVMS